MDQKPDFDSQTDDRDLMEGERELSRRLDDLRGLGLLPDWSHGLHMRGEGPLLRLSLSLVDLLESAQRRVIETSIQLLSLRELIGDLLTMRTPEDVAQTVTLYLHKAFDHERVLVALHDRERDTLEGWTAVRRGSPRCTRFVLGGEWDGAVREALEREVPIRSWHDETLRPLVRAGELPRSLAPFEQEAVGPYVVHPLCTGQGRNRAVGVLAVARGFGAPTMDGMDAEILQSLVESVSTALENVILDEDVRREEAFRKDIMGNMPSGLIAVDLEGRVLTMNDRAEALSGYALEDLKGEPTARLGAGRDGIDRLLERTLGTRRGLRSRETVLRKAAGGAIPIACTTSLLRNPKDEVYGALLTFEDLTDLKAMEQRIRQLDRLAALGRFTAGVAHEIRNPLAGIAAGVQYLARHLREEPGQQENLDFIQTEIERLNRIVEDLFQVTHPSPPRRTPERMDRLAAMAARCLDEAAAARGVGVAIDVPADLPDVPVDPDQIQQVLLNLIKNAIEASPRGGEVRITAAAGEREEREELAVRIEDRGPGIDPASLHHIFEPFFTKGKAGGTGLGLYVSHGIVERHGGELLAANRDGGGAVFTLRLPLAGIDITETPA